MDKRLVHNLAEAGKSTETLKFPDGSEVIVLPYGGRILGLFAEGDARNFYWIHPALRKSATARAFFSSGKWQNTGGERTWLGPEVDFFLPRFPDPTGYRPPPPLDAGTYRVSKKAGVLGLALTFTVTSYRRSVSLKLRLAKSIEPAADPLRAERDFLRPKGLKFAGYTLRTHLQFAGAPDPAASVGIWSLTQMPQGGAMIAPTYGPVRPLLYFGKMGRRDLAVKPSFLRCRMREGGYYKIGLRAVSTTGRIGYFHESPDSTQLVIRNFFGNPSGDYVDAPSSDPSDAGYGVQFCNVSDKELGNFSELEYHVPAIGGPAGKASMEDVAQVWAYRGERAELALVARKLLGVPVFL